MAVLKCKMCGGALEVAGESVITCEYCGTAQTLPRLSDDKKIDLYDRANHFRRNNEYDKAAGIYEHILNEDKTDAEAYWSLVLCRYGIEYVEDPSTHKRIPTVNRVRFTSIFDDANYRSALQHADAVQKSIYEEEAKAINEIQKGMLAISQKEEPFDIFICYKETDNNGRRTQDSVLANELYHQLAAEGYKVFFSRITLEDKLGVAYEPYIFAALNSAKVMVVLGTKPENFNAVWVKNEWSRYLALIRNGADKVLIPAYRDMDPYDLPEEFSHLQAQDMSKLGFMQDLIRGIKKITQTDVPSNTVVRETVVTGNTAGGNVTALLKRGYMALEDGEWSKADDFFEQTLNYNAELAEAYLGKMMAELRVSKKEALKENPESFDQNGNYQKILRFADDTLKTELKGYIEYINNRNKENTYSEALSLMSDNTVKSLEKAREFFVQIKGYKDSDRLEEKCKCRIETLKQKAEQAKAKIKRNTVIGVITAVLLITCFCIIPYINRPEVNIDGMIFVKNDDGYRLSDYNGNSTDISIPDKIAITPVISIENEAFSRCYSLKSITISDSVTTIGDSAFSYCESLTSIAIPDSVTTIGDSAFSFCESLTSIAIPDSVTTIGDSAFSFCDSLKSITIPDSVTTIGDSAFYSCDSLTSITIPNSVTSIGNEAFSECDSFTSIAIPDSVTSIGNNAFSHCDSLTSIAIPDSVITIGDDAFYFCDSLTSITVAEGNEYYKSFDGVLFDKDMQALIQYPIGNQRTEYIIPNSVTSIGDYAFSSYDSLTSITISDSVITIEDNAFYLCDSLTSITVAEGNECYKSFDGVLFDKDMQALVQYPIGNQRTEYLIPNSVTSIGDYAFSCCDSLTSIAIPGSVTTIGDSAFYNCKSLTSITIPDSVTTIGDDAFSSCDSFEKITFLGEETEFGEDVFGYIYDTVSFVCPAGSDAEAYANKHGISYTHN